MAGGINSRKNLFNITFRLSLPAPTSSLMAASAPIGIPRNTFQLCSKNLFLTFPQCDYPLADFVTSVKAFFTDLKILKGVASQEQHEDGNNHLHLFVSLEKQCRTRNVNYFDNLVVPPKHPNIVSRVKSQLKCIQYVIKDGTFEPLPDANSFDLQLYLMNAQSKKSTALSMIQSIQAGATIDQLDDEHPGYLLLHQASVQRYLDFLALKHLRQSRAQALQTVFRVCPANGHTTSSNEALASWMNSNIRQIRAHRTPQIWIKAGPGMGKTTLLNVLEDVLHLSIYRWPLDEKWFDGYSDGAFDLIVLDEYKAHKKITELNPILSGDRIPLSRRSQPPLVKRDNLPVMILSNYSPAECYHKASPMSLSTLTSRLIVIDFADTFIRIVPAEVVDLSGTESPITDAELDELFLSVDMPISTSPSPMSPSRTIVPLTLSQELDDPNNPYWYRPEYIAERDKRMRQDDPEPVPRLTRFQRSIHPKPHKRPRNNAVFYFETEAGESDPSSDDTGEDQYDVNDPFINDLLSSDSE